MQQFRKLFLSVILVFAGSVAQAGENLALIIVNKDYRNYANVGDAFDVTSLTRQLQSADFKIQSVRNMNLKGLGTITPSLRSKIDSADRVLVFIAGQVVSSDRESWLLTTDAPIGDGLLAGRFGLPIQSVMDLLGSKAGSAVLMVGYPGSSKPVVAGLKTGFFPVAIPQGVTVFSGRPRDLVRVLSDGLLVEGTSMTAVVEDAPRSVTAYGYISPVAAFLPVTVAPVLSGNDSEADELEQLIWNNARASGTEAGLDTYLRRYPNGRYTVQANEMLTALLKSPVDLAREVEEALALDRETRREIQRDLSLLGYDTRGVDGIFGRGTRAAVVAWQGTNGISETGYLSGNQIAALKSEAAVRAEELEEEARIRRAEHDRRDATYWRSTGRGADETGLRAYLKRFPDGLYSEIALERLEVFDAERRRTAALAESNAWDLAREVNSLAGYQDFLRTYPDGAFSDTARDKVAKLTANESNNAAKREEQRVLNNPITRLLVEQQLAAIGLKPGKVDGKYDDATRKAIRRFQRSADLPVSGYVTQATIVRLLAVR